jgi:prepilin-type N-terminal cleavage/methylation domain-containing protein/prepilin-type processing-associated H-X9-DG protein
VRPRFGFTLVELIVAVAILAVLAGLVLSAVAMVRADSLKAVCSNNLRQIGVAITQYHDQNRVLPTGLQVKGDAMEGMGWQGPILPYLEQEELWNRTKIAFAAGLTPNSREFPLNKLVVKAYGCPLDPGTGYIRNESENSGVCYGSYYGVAGISFSQEREPGGVPGGVFFESSKIAFAHITDGLSTTLMVGERPLMPEYPAGIWYGAFEVGDAVMGVEEGHYNGLLPNPNDPRQCADFIRYGPQSKTKCDAFHYWSFHKSGAHFLFADGSVRFMTYTGEPAMKPLSTRNRGDSIPGE